MAKLALDVVIQAPVDRVAAFFVPQRMPYWFGTEMHAEFEVQGGAADFAVGQKVCVSGRAGISKVTLTAVVTALEQGCLLEWRFHDAYGVRGMQRWELKGEGEATRVTMKDEFEMAGRVGQLYALFTRHAVARRDRAWLAKLKQLAERA